MSKTVIMCGGPADGRWVVVPGGDRDWYAIKPFRIDLGSIHDPVEPLGPVPERVRYNIRPIMILGHELWIGVAVDEAYDDRAVMRAIIQRDVAAHLGAYR